MSAPALELDAITKRFGAVTALDGAAITVQAGTVHALLGENGAGKSTLMRIAFGMLVPDAGAVRVNGAARRFASARDAIAAGLGMVHQHFSLVPALTVAENVALGGHGRFDRALIANRVRELGDATGLVLDPGAAVSTLPVSAQQRLEILKALARNARILILDEPTAVLAPAEARDLLQWVKRWATGDHAAVLITHHLRDALSIADDVTVLRRGRTVLTRAADGLDESTLVMAMLGEPLSQGTDERARETLAGSTVLALHAARVVDARGVQRLAPTTCAVRAGEIVGVAGVEGSGQAELLRLLAGRLSPTSGSVTVPPSVGFVPADRHRDAVVLDMPLVENLALKDAASAPPWMPWRQLRGETSELLAHFDVRASGADAEMRSLSGGNQQKFVLARELTGAPTALVVENPTRGLDIRAAESVRSRLRAARNSGLAVVMYTEDLDEVLALADRVLVVHAGEVTEPALDRDAVGRAMLGAR